LVSSAFQARAKQRRGAGLLGLGPSPCSALVQAFGAFLVAAGAKAFLLAQGSRGSGTADRAAKPVAGGFEAHGQFAAAGQRSAGRRTRRGAQPFAHLRQAAAVHLKHLDVAARLGGGSGGEPMLDAADAGNAGPLGSTAHSPNAEVSAATD
jgi:hypothetical protein